MTEDSWKTFKKRRMRTKVVEISRKHRRKQQGRQKTQRTEGMIAESGEWPDGGSGDLGSSSEEVA